MSYKTPKSLGDTPPEDLVADADEGESVQSSDQESEESYRDLSDARPHETRKLVLSWHGHSRADLQNMWQTALTRRNEGKSDVAEQTLKQVVVGLNHVLGKTNEDTIKAKYNLASLFAESGQMEEAIDIVEEVIQDHLDLCGYKDKKTQQNVLQAVELLNGWNRQADALSLLSLSKEVLYSSSDTHSVRKAGVRAGKKRDTLRRHITDNFQTDLSAVIESITEDSSPGRFDYGLEVARMHVASKDQGAEGLIQAMISQSEGHPDLAIQHLKAHAELLKLYDKLDQATEKSAAFETALGSFREVWEAYIWEEDTIESLDFAEAALQLAANVLKCFVQADVKKIFRDVVDKASAVFGYDDERTVWILITIGLVYQTHMTWDDAEEWFQEAFSAALANPAWGPKDGIVRSLQNAMDHNHFSYVSDEGRPYKTIFGVSGLKIMPGRLHLE